MTVSADGLVTLVGTGIDMVTLSHSCLSASYKFKIDSAILPDGTYFLKNKRTEKYVDIYAQNMANGTDIHQWDFHGGNTQRWIFSYLGEGYYTFKSANSSDDYYLGVKNDGTAADTQIVLRTGTITDGMKWKIETTSSGAYKITPKTGEPNDRVLAVEWFPAFSDTDNTFSINGSKIRQRDYVEDGNFKDEWLLLKVGYASTVSLEGQKKSNWCWAASSRMFSKHFYSTVTYTQNQAVTNVKGSEVNEGGTNEEIISAIDYYISNTYNASLNLNSYIYEIYSESTLIDFLDDGYVVAIGRGWYTNIDNPNSINGAHETLVIGYVRLNSKVWFIVHDPWPVNNGETYLMSYEKMVNGRNAQDGESSDTGVWIDCVVINTSYCSNTIAYFFGS